MNIQPSANVDLIDADDAAHVLWHFGLDPNNAKRPGEFTAALLRALGNADPMNRALLSLGFPGLVAAYELAANDSVGAAMLSAIVDPRLLGAACPVREGGGERLSLRASPVNSCVSR